MRDGYLNGREAVGGRHWYLHSARRDHLSRLRYGRRKFGRKLRMGHEKAPDGDGLEDNVQWADRHRSRAHSRKGDERTAGRERRCEHARRRAADTVKRETELSLIDRGFDPFRDIWRIDDDDVAANSLKLIHELWPADDVDGLQAALFRERDNPSPDTGVGGVLHHPLARFQIDILTEQESRGRRIDCQHRQLLRVDVAGQGEKTVCGNDQPLPPGEAGERRQNAVAGLDVLYSRPDGENAADTFIANDSWKRRAQ